MQVRLDYILKNNTYTKLYKTFWGKSVAIFSMACILSDTELLFW